MIVQVYVGSETPWPLQVNRTLEFLHVNRVDLKIIRKPIPPQLTLEDPTLRTLPLVVVSDTDRWAGHQPDRLRTLCEDYVYLSSAETQADFAHGEGVVPSHDSPAESGSSGGDPKPT